MKVGRTRDLADLARKQLEDYDNRNPGTLFDDPLPISLNSEAYQLQLEVAKLRVARGESIAGYKIGCVSDVVRAQLGMDRALFGHVYSSEVHRSAAELSSKAYANLAIEGEFALRLAQDIPDSDWLQGNKQTAVQSIFPVIELHNYVLRSKQHGLELIANNGIHAGVVLPWQENGVCTLETIPDETISVIRSGEILGQTTAGAISGGPWSSLLGLVEHLSIYGIRLKRGQLVLTGSPLPLYPVQAGDRLQVRTGRSGEVSCRIS